MTFPTRTRLAFAVVVAVSLVSFGALARRISMSYALPTSLDRLADHAVLLYRELDTGVESARADVLALAWSPTTVAAAGAPDFEASRAELELVLAAVLRAKDRYLQLRLIDAGGVEIVRVDRPTEGGPVRVVPRDQLQSKAHRPYVRATLELPAGETHVTAIEPNEEFGEVDEPYVPVLRAATPVAPPGSGIVVVNVDMRPALERVRLRGETTADVYLLSARGEYLVHPDSARQFGIARGLAESDLDHLAALMGSGSVDSVATSILEGPDGTQLAVAAVTGRPAGGPATTLVAAERLDDLLAGYRELNRSLFILGAVVLLVAVLLANVVAGSLTRPVQEMAAAVERFEIDGAWIPPPSAGGELGKLSKTLGHMIVAERERAAAVEREQGSRIEAERLRDAEAERTRTLAAVVSSSGDGIYTHTLDGVISSWNPGAKRLYGHRAEEAVGRPVESLVPPDGRERLGQLLEAVRRGVPVRDVETVHLTRDGTPLDVSLTLSPILDAEGGVIGGSVIARDVSTRKELEERLRLTVEASPSGMVMVDHRGDITLVNREAERLFGYSRDELIGEPVEVLIPGAYREAHPSLREGFAEAPARRGMGTGRDLYGRRKDGVDIPVEIGLNPISRPEGLAVLASIVDISERKRAQDELRRSNAELEQFAYVASHDLREPLRQISSYTELLSRRYGGQLDERADKYIHYAVDGAQRMQLLIDGLLRFSRVTSEAQPHAPVDASAVVRDIMETELRMAIRETDAAVDVDPLPMVFGDEEQLAHVFQNLVSNALKFHDEGSRPLVRVSAQRKDDRWRFSVSDNGIGIAKEYQERVFEMFQRLHGVGTYPGSGIGLPLARKIVERHGGTIWFESEEGHGTTFYFTLPVVNQ